MRFLEFRNISKDSLEVPVGSSSFYFSLRYPAARSKSAGERHDRCRRRTSSGARHRPQTHTRSRDTDEQRRQKLLVGCIFGTNRTEIPTSAWFRGGCRADARKISVPRPSGQTGRFLPVSLISYVK